MACCPCTSAASAAVKICLDLLFFLFFPVGLCPKMSTVEIKCLFHLLPVEICWNQMGKSWKIRWNLSTSMFSTFLSLKWINGRTFRNRKGRTTVAVLKPKGLFLDALKVHGQRRRRRLVLAGFAPPGALHFGFLDGGPFFPGKWCEHRCF